MEWHKERRDGKTESREQILRHPGDKNPGAQPKRAAFPMRTARFGMPVTVGKTRPIPPSGPKMKK